MIEFPYRVCCKAVSVKHRAIECDLCKKRLPIKCNKFDQKDYKFHQDNPNEPFYCIKCSSENIVFSTLNDSQFKICVTKGINYSLDDEITYKPSTSELRLFNTLNNAINSNTFDIIEEDNEDSNGITIDCNYYNLDEFVSAKFKSSKTFSILHLNIHSVEKHIGEFRIILEML